MAWAARHRRLEVKRWAWGALREGHAGPGVSEPAQPAGGAWAPGGQLSSLKLELVHGADFATRGQARPALFEYIKVFYNRQRRHCSLVYLSPVDVELAALPQELAA
jgi:transposase InsO family protein